MAEPGFLPFLTVQCSRLDIFIFFGSVRSLDFKYGTVAEGNFCIGEKGAADIVDGHSRSDRVEAQ